MNLKSELSKEDLIQLIRTVFSPRTEDKALAILIDIPNTSKQDNHSWKNRRKMAHNWVEHLRQAGKDLPFETCDLIFYPNIRSNNADLPPLGYELEEFSESLYGNRIKSKAEKYLLEQKLSTYQILLAPTEFSATAPLKLLAKKFGFRAATMPGFSEAMIPALKLNYQKIHNRVNSIKQLLDKAVEMDIQFSVNIKTYKAYLDIRNRTAHNSSGLFPESGTAGNLPSGECYIVPNEGKEEKSQSKGILPVQFENEVVLYRIENNRAVEILSEGQYSAKEKIKIGKEPAYANIAEIGFGVLKNFGIQPSGEMLLDEKLGLHVAFGRSDHFGGTVGPDDFSSPDQVVHIDRIYIPQIQNKIHVDHVSLEFENGTSQRIMENGEYTLF